MSSSSARSYPPWTCPGCGLQHGIWVGSCYKCGTNQPVGYCDDLRKKERDNKEEEK
jgi:predicted ATP-dependent serine protease